MEKIKSFTDLIAWQEGHKLVLQTYKLVDKFPQKEMYALGDQMRRCCVSITSNIAEGFSRQGFREKIQFYYTALGSVTELQNQLIMTRDIGYLNKENFAEIAQQTIQTSKLVNGLIKKIKSLNT